MRPKRTVRKPTRWTPDEWRRVEDAARACRVPPLRFVRETVLRAAQGGAAPPPAKRRRVRDEVVHQLARVLNNLRQIERIAHEDGDADMVLLAASAAQVAEQAIKKAPGAREATGLVEQLITTGRALNEVAHRANTDEELPPAAEVMAAVEEVFNAIRRALP